jgi:hypothetical protein
MHERLSRDLSKQQLDDEERRLDALKANDFDAYKEMLKKMCVVFFNELGTPSTDKPGINNVLSLLEPLIFAERYQSCQP